MNVYVVMRQGEHDPICLINADDMEIEEVEEIFGSDVMVFEMDVLSGADAEREFTL